MSQISDGFKQAELAQAAYADLFEGIDQDRYLAALVDGGRNMAGRQGERFVARYRVVAQCNESSGLSATVFVDEHGQKYLAIRGTDGGYDFATDLVDIAILGSTNNQTQYAQLKAKVRQWIDDGTLKSTYPDETTGDQFTVAGHSLGGFLATGIAADYSSYVTHTYLYNAPGLGGIVGAVLSPFDALRSALGISASSIDPNKVSNIKAEAGISPIAGLGLQVAPPIPIVIENQFLSDVENPPAALNHSMQTLTDALALYDVLAGLDGNLSAEDFNKLVKADSERNRLTLESALDILRAMLPGNGLTLTTVGSRDAFYTNLYALKTGESYSALSASGRAQVSVLADKTAAQIVSLAGSSDDDGLAVRYALSALNPFALVGADYDGFNASGGLDLYSAASPNGMTERYLADRANFLERKLWFSTEDLSPVDPLLADYDPDKPRTFANEPDSNFFVDVSSGYQIRLGPLFNNTHLYAFGGAGADVFTGQAVEDHLYGGPGSDFLRGGRGNDYLEGGAGMDAYVFRAGDGNDTIFDAGGSAVILREGKAIAPGIRQDATHWLSGGATYSQLDESTLQISFTGSADTITVRDFDFDAAQTGRYAGIQLVETVAAPQSPIRTFLGDKQDYDADPNQAGIQSIDDGLGNTVRADGLDGRPDMDQASRQDVFFGAADAIEQFSTADGDDVVYSDGSGAGDVGGSDAVFTGQGHDYVVAGGGEDWVEGGADADILSGNAGDDVVYADTSGEQTLTLASAIAAGETAEAVAGAGNLISGDLGHDVIIGANTADAIFGGADEDVLVGGGGDDVLYGDGSFDTATLGWTLSRIEVENTDGGKTYSVNFSGVSVSTVAEGASDVIYAGAGDDWVFAGAGDDYVEGGNGGDVVFGDAGDDVLIGGDGDDVLEGDSAEADAAGYSGDDYLDGSAGNDTLKGNDGNDLLIGGEGDDTLIGGGGDDILWGGPGLDVLLGGAGKDTYIFNRGDGVEVIQDLPEAPNAADGSVLVLGEGIGRSQVKFRIGSLMVDLGDGDAIHFDGWDADDPLATRALDSIVFADGEVMSYEDVLAQGFEIDGTDGNDLLRGTAVRDSIDARGGDDFVIGGSGDDTISGGDGNDFLTGEDGNDALNGGAGTDRLEGGDGDDALTSGDGTDILRGGFGNDALDGEDGNDDLEGEEGSDRLSGGAGNDRLSGGEGDDILDGGAGSDELSGGTGSDTYLFSRGDGVETIREEAMVAAGIGDAWSTDTIRFASDIAAPDVTFARRANGDLVIDYGAADRVTVKGQYVGSANAVERIEFGDGAVVDYAALEALPVAPITGTTGSDQLSGTEAGDRIVGLQGDDMLEGGAGNDLLEGGAGADSYLVHVGMGADTIVDVSPTDAEAGTLRVADGLDLDSLAARRQNEDLLVSIRGRPDSAQIKGYYAPGGEQHWQLAFVDGTTAPIQDLIDRPDPDADAEALAAMADYRVGIVSGWRALSHGTVTFPDHGQLYSSWSQTETWFRVDRYHPFQLISTVTASEAQLGNYGVGTGRSFTALANPQVTYNVTPMSVVQASDAAEIHVVGVPTSSSTTQVFPVSPYQLFRGGSVYPSVTVVSSSINSYSVNVFVSSNTMVPVVIGGSSPVGSFSVTTQNENRVIEEIRAGASDNAITGASGGNHVALIDAGEGDDTVQAGPEDFVYGNDGNDNVQGGDLVYGGNGDDTLRGGQRLYGGAGNDTLVAGAFMDGGAGDDVLSGGTTMNGGAGNDLLTGDGARNVYLIDPSDLGSDVVIDMDGVDPADFAQWYYARAGIEDFEESAQFGGWWTVVGESGFPLSQAFNRFASEHPDQPLRGVIDDFYRDGNGYGFDAFAIAYATLQDLRAELQFFRVPYRPDDIRYVRPLAEVPDLDTLDQVALQKLYDVGLIPTDTVEFGDGLSLGDLTLMHSREDDALEFYWGGSHKLSVALSHAGDPIGAGVEQFRFADNSVFSISDLMAFAGPYRALATEGDDSLFYTVGDDIGAALGGDDRLFSEGGSDFLDGGAGNDRFLVAGRAFVVGGPGDDWIETRGEATVVAFNPGDGADTVYVAAGALVLSVGGGVQPGDLWLRAEGVDLVLSLASGDSIRLSRQLEVDPYAWPQITLQLFGSVHTYDFNAVIGELYAWPDPSVPMPLDGVLQQHDLSVSGSDAMGGVLAWLQATAGDVSLLTDDEILTVLADSDFALAPQPIPATEGVTLVGTDGDDVLVGSQGEDSLDGGLGRDTLIGGLGDDTYIVDRARDLVIESPDEGTDAIYSSASYALPANVENLVISGSAARGTGNDLDNVITGNAAANVLDGGTGADLLIGGPGNDSYVVDDPGDMVVETTGEGVDTVRAWVNYTLPENVEKLVLLGAESLTGIGNALDNVITGNAATSTLAGGAGDDIYVIDNSDVLIVEAFGEGADTVKSSASYILPDNVEDLILTGVEAIDGTGNAIGNVITGNAASNFLEGGAGDDALKGGAGGDWLAGGEGDDTMFVDDPDDVVIEYPDEGIDTVKSSIDWRLGDNVENLTLTGTADLNGFGNELANVIAGNKGCNLLQGDGGNDTLTGNAANDILQGGWGSDILRGGGGNNVLDGGAGNDKLVGGDGNELFFGGSGNDAINTGAGADVIAFNRGDGQDAVAASQGADNTLSLGGGIRREDLVFRKSGSNLVLQTGVHPDTGSSDQVTFNAWYSTTADNRSVSRLELIGDSSPAGNIETFDFIGLVDAFNAARAANPGITTWALASALPAYRTGSNDNEAVGGDLASTIAKNGSLVGMGLDQARAALDNVDFGSQPQGLTQVFVGGAGADHLAGGGQNAALLGGAGDDALTGGDDDDFFAGDAGDDVIDTGGGVNVIAFNAGGGTDTIYSGDAASNTISLGGGIQYGDLSLSKNGDDLVLSTGSDDSLVLKDWYAGKDDVAKLQVILDATNAFAPGSEDPLYASRAQTFDFRGLVSRFDQALAEQPGLTSWALSNALLDWHLSHSDDAALGGDLAYWYGKNGTLAGMSIPAAQAVIGATGFGSEAQQLHAFSGLQEGLARLA